MQGSFALFSIGIFIVDLGPTCSGFPFYFAAPITQKREDIEKKQKVGCEILT